MNQTFRCLYCGGDPLELNHERRCDGRQGGRDDEPFNPRAAFGPPPAVGLTTETYTASQAAADQVEPCAATLRGAVLAYIRGRASGATDDEIQEGLALPGNTERPRRWELYNAGLIISDGFRVNARGRKVAVWVVVSR